MGQGAQLSPTVGRRGRQCGALALTAWFGSWQRGLRVEFGGAFPSPEYDAMSTSRERAARS